METFFTQLAAAALKASLGQKPRSILNKVLSSDAKRRGERGAEPATTITTARTYREIVLLAEVLRRT